MRSNLEGIVVKEIETLGRNIAPVSSPRTNSFLTMSSTASATASAAATKSTKARKPRNTVAKSDKPRSARVKKADRPVHQPRPPSAYVIFMQDTRPRIVSENPEATFTQISGLVSAVWRDLDDEAKKAYQKRADAARAAAPVVVASAERLFAANYRSKEVRDKPDMTEEERKGLVAKAKAAWLNLDADARKPWHDKEETERARKEAKRAKAASDGEQSNTEGSAQ